MKAKRFPRLIVFLSLLVGALGLLLFSTPTYADWLGLGQASEAIAGATWKVVAIRAIRSAQFVILMGLDLWALTWVAGKLGTIMERVTQDNVVSRAERILVGLYSCAVGAVAFLALPLGWALLERIFS